MIAEREFKTIAAFPIREGSLCLTLLILSLLLCRSAQSQWVRLAQFPHLVPVVHFLSLGGTPRVGFVTSGGARADQTTGAFRAPGQVWKTTDGGYTWRESHLLQPAKEIVQFCFRDSLTGWAAALDSEANDGWGACYLTSDGGETWQRLLGSEGAATAVYYNAYNKLLLLSKWGGKANAGNPSNSLMSSTDEGQSWRRMGPPLAANGLAFVDSVHGVTWAPASFWITSDGGLSWSATDGASETWQPLGISGSSTFLAAPEGSPAVLCSTDAGMSWRKRAVLRYDHADISGMIAGDFRALLLQTKDGFLASYDSGYTWRLVCGPPSGFDIRFYLRDNFLYASDSSGALWLNTHALGRGVPVFYDWPMQLPANCGQESLRFPFCYSDPCAGAATLNSVTASGSKDISIEPGFMPREVSDLDSFSVRYACGIRPDTVYATFHFTFQGEQRDTTIMLVAPAALAALGISPQSRKIRIRPGSFDSISICSRGDIPKQLGLTSLHCSCDVGTDMVAKPTASIGMNGWNVTNEVMNGSDLTLDLSRATPVDIYAGDEIVRIPIEAFVAPDTVAAVVLKDYSFNADFKGCTPEAITPDTVTITISPECGDRTLRQYMLGESLAIESISPNPASKTIEVKLRGAESIELVDVLGRVAIERQAAATLTLDVSRLDPGTYFVRATGPAGVRSARVIVER